MTLANKQGECCQCSMCLVDREEKAIPARCEAADQEPPLSVDLPVGFCEAPHMALLQVCLLRVAD